MKTRRRWIARIGGNWLTSFLSPLVGTSIAFSIPDIDDNLRVLITALVSSAIVTGLVIARELEKWGNAKSTN